MPDLSHIVTDAELNVPMREVASTNEVPRPWNSPEVIRAALELPIQRASWLLREMGIGTISSTANAKNIKSEASIDIDLTTLAEENKAALKVFAAANPSRLHIDERSASFLLPINDGEVTARAISDQFVNLIEQSGLKQQPALWVVPQTPEQLLRMRVQDLYEMQFWRTANKPESVNVFDELMKALFIDPEDGLMMNTEIYEKFSSSADFLQQHGIIVIEDGKPVFKGLHNPEHMAASLGMVFDARDNLVWRAEESKEYYERTVRQAESQSQQVKRQQKTSAGHINPVASKELPITLHQGVSDAFVGVVRSRISQLPPEVQTLLAEGGWQVRVIKNATHDRTKFDTLDAPEIRTAGSAASTGPKEILFFEYQLNLTARGEGKIVSVLSGPSDFEYTVRHEFGHALDRQLGISASTGVRAAHNIDTSGMLPAVRDELNYFQGESGRAEVVADRLAERLKHWNAPERMHTTEAWVSAHPSIDVAFDGAIKSHLASRQNLQPQPQQQQQARPTPSAEEIARQAQQRAERQASTAQAPAERPVPSLTPEERNQYKIWMQQAEKSAGLYNGSEVSYERLFEPLLAMDAFIRGKNSGAISDTLVGLFAQQAWPEKAVTLGGFESFLDAASAGYTRNIRGSRSYEDVLALIQKGGAVVTRHTETFVQTDAGEIRAAQTANPESLEFRTQPRLARLIEHLQQAGIYTDDIIVRVATPDPGMVRKLPYVVLYIPRIDKEIAVCDQVGEITFIANKRLGPDVWAHLSKDQLKARPEISTVVFHNEEHWWENIRSNLMAEGEQPGRKVDITKAAGKRPPIDIELLKQSVLKHREATGKWPTASSGTIQYGPYAGKENWGTIHAGLERGTRGLAGGSSLPSLNEEVSKENGLDYVNNLRKEPYEIDKIKASILAHRQATGEWPTKSSGDIKYGPYAGEALWSAIDAGLQRGVRGLAGGSSLPSLNEEVSKENGLDYVNNLRKEPYEIDKIKASILAHRQATGEWPTTSSGDVKDGPYAGKENWGAIGAGLEMGTRGLAGGSYLANLNEEVSREHGLDYVHNLKRGHYEIDKIKASILAHRQATEEWPKAKSGTVQHGPYAGKENWAAINAGLGGGTRGLAGGSSLANLNEEVSKENGLDYVNNLRKERYEIDKIKASILAHHQATGEWPTANSGMVGYGPYAGKENWGRIHASLERGTRGLAGGSSLASLNEEVSREHGLDYKNKFKQGPYEIDKIKASILAHRQATGEWPTRSSGDVKHGPYAGKENWGAIGAGFVDGTRGLAGGSSLASLNEEVSREHGLDYKNKFKQESYEIDKIKASILTHRQATGKWPTAKSGTVQHGPYAGKENWAAIQTGLVDGIRGLAGGSSLASLNEEVSREHGLDYVNNLRKEPYDIDKIKESMLAHYEATGKWPNSNSATVQHGPYAGVANWGSINSGLIDGVRGLPGGSTLTTLRNEILKGTTSAVSASQEAQNSDRVTSNPEEASKRAGDNTDPSKGNRPKLERRTFGPDGMPIDYDLEAALARRAVNVKASNPPANNPVTSPAEAKPTIVKADIPTIKTARVAGVSASASGGALGIAGIAGRVGNTLGKATQVGGEQLATEQRALAGDVASVVTGAADLLPQMSGPAGAAARAAIRVSPIVAAGAAYLEVKAANAAQDGRRGVAAIGGFSSAMGVGLATGAAAGSVLGPWGAAIGGIVGALGAGHGGSEIGRTSQWGDQRQRDLDHKAQYALDQSVEIITELGRKRLRGEEWTDADKAAIRSIGGVMVEHITRMQVLEIPATDIDGRLRQQYQIQQTQHVIDYLNGKTERLPMTSQQRDAHLISSIDTLLPALNDPKLGWKRWLTNDKASPIERADILRTLSEYGVELHTLDKDGRYGITIDELTTVLKDLKVDQRGKVTPTHGASRVELPPEINDETHENFRDGMIEKTGSGQKRFEAAVAKLIPELQKAGFGNTLGDKDGVINPEKLAEVIKRTGIRPSEVDRNGNGTITAQEAIGALRAHGLHLPEQKGR